MSKKGGPSFEMILAGFIFIIMGYVLSEALSGITSILFLLLIFLLGTFFILRGIGIVKG